MSHSSFPSRNFATNMIFGCSSLRLTTEETALFKEVKPWGFILFSRNIESPDQVKALTDDFKKAVGRDEVIVLIDQEGGRVSRLPSSFWRIPPSPTLFPKIYKTNPEKAVEAITLNYRLIAHDLKELGINVNCAPMLDIPKANSSPVVTDRALGMDAETVTQLAKATIAGLKAGGVAAVIKHGPGHGRATVDSHHELPRVTASLKELKGFDFLPFKALKNETMLMTAHIIYEAIDAALPATISPQIIQKIIREELGFKGLIMTDDINMHALTGSVEQRARFAMEAGCDMILHCSGVFEEMTRLAPTAQPLKGIGLIRAKAAEEEAFAKADSFDAAKTQEALGQLIKQTSS